MSAAKLSRRAFVRHTGLGALAFNVAGQIIAMSPRDALARGVAYQHLNPDEAELLAAVADHLLPGAADAGIAHFVDQQVGVDPQECLLMCKYFPEIKPPFVDFYRTALAALRLNVRASNDKNFSQLTSDEKNAITDSLWGNTVAGWSGPPPPLCYMMLRSDAVDVVYGTQGGFDALNIPYLAHIAPPETW